MRAIGPMDSYCRKCLGGVLRQLVFLSLIISIFAYPNLLLEQRLKSFTWDRVPLPVWGGPLQKGINAPNPPVTQASTTSTTTTEHLDPPEPTQIPLVPDLSLHLISKGAVANLDESKQTVVAVVTTIPPETKLLHDIINPKPRASDETPSLPREVNVTYWGKKKKRMQLTRTRSGGPSIHAKCRTEYQLTLVILVAALVVSIFF